MVCESATHKGASHGRNAIHGTDDTSVDGSLPEGYRVGDNDQGTREDASRAYTSDGSANDEGDRCWCSAADKRAELEDGNGSQINPFDAEEGIKLAKEELECAGSEQVRRTIPAHIVERIEMVGYFGDRSGNYGVVQRHEQDGQA